MRIILSTSYKPSFSICIEWSFSKNWLKTAKNWLKIAKNIQTLRFFSRIASILLSTFSTILAVDRNRNRNRNQNRKPQIKPQRNRKVDFAVFALRFFGDAVFALRF